MKSSPACVVLLLLTTGCSATTGTRDAAELPSETGLIRVERDTASPGWLATWQLESPARELRFERPANGFRASAFEIITPGYRVTRDGDMEVMRTDGEPQREIRVRFPEFDRQLVREYEFFRRFSDGGVAIYTGHLVARPVGDGGERPFLRHFRFVPPPGAAVVLGGRRHEGAVEWSDGSGRGTYVYIGSAVPISSDDVIAIVDPGLPAWLESLTSDALPRLFALYRDRLHAEPDARPMVLFDYKEGDATGYSNGGGTLPGQIQLGVEGRAWSTESRPAMLQLVHFLAHEAAHVWNGEIAHYPGSEDAWMHEGSADALAERALLELGILDRTGVMDLQTAALNDCRAGLLATSLRTSTQQGRPRMAYTCGNMIALLTEAALLPRGADLFDFWAALIARAEAKGGLYDARDYVGVWRTLGATDVEVEVLEAFLDGSMDPDRLAQSLRAGGVDVDPAEPPASYGQALARDALARLMAADCGGRVGFRSSSEGFLLDDGLDCGTFAPGAIVLAIGGHNLLEAGHLAYDHARDACSEDRPARIGLVHDDGNDRDVEVACEEELPARASYVRVTTWPAGANR